MQWLNPPDVWQQSGSRLTLKTRSNTDFWRVTHYGFIRDNGHFYFDEITTDFTLEVTIRGQYRDLYDQAGLMLRVDDQHWIKTGIEYVDGVQNLSAVVTHGYSDWSKTPLPNAPEALQLWVQRRQEAIHIFYRDQTSEFVLFRLAYLPTSAPMQVGLMAASPDGEGFEVVFEDFQINGVEPGAAG